jgi:cytochrome c oxidase assembly factor CtaG
MKMVVSHWSANAVIIVAYAVTAAVHLRGVHGTASDARRRGRTRQAGSVWEAVAFHTGLLVVVLSLVSPVGYWSQRLIWVRSVQDVLLATVAPLLIVLGAPWQALRRGLRRGYERDTDDPGPRRGAAAAHAGPPGWLTLPVLVTAMFNIVWCGWHLPVLYDAALRYPVAYSAEVAAYLAAGVLLWAQLIGSRPFSPRFGPLYRVMLIAGTTVAGTVLAMVLVFGSGVVYPAYLGIGHPSLSVVADQQVSGAVLLVLALPAFVITGVALLIRWLNDEQNAALSVDFDGAGFDKLLKPRGSAWPSRPGLR